MKSSTAEILRTIQGDSAYKIWLAAGNTGSEQDFLNSLQAKDYVPTEEELQKIAQQAAELVEVPEFPEDTATEGWVKEYAQPKGSYVTEGQLHQAVEDVLATGGGITPAQSNSLWAILQKTAFTQALTDAELTAFKTAWGIGGSVEPDTPVDPAVTLTSISATYTGGDVATGTAVTDLTGITVTATYSDGTTATVTGYTLSGEIIEGENTITVFYGGKTTTFTVTGIVESGGGDTTAELVTDGLVGFWDFRNCDYTASSMPATVGDAGLVRFGGTSSDDYGIVANTAFAYNPAGSGGYTTFTAPLTIVSMGYATDKADEAPSLWNNLIVSSNLANEFANLSGVRWFNSAGTNTTLGTGTSLSNPSIPLNSLGSGYCYLIITIDDSNVMKYYYQGELVMTLDPVELGLTDFDHWNTGTAYIGNNDKSKPATAVAIYDRAITELEAVEMFNYLKTLEVA